MDDYSHLRLHDARIPRTRGHAGTPVRRPARRSWRVKVRSLLGRRQATAPQHTATPAPQPQHAAARRRGPSPDEYTGPRLWQPGAPADLVTPRDHPPRSGPAGAATGAPDDAAVTGEPPEPVRVR